MREKWKRMNNGEKNSWCLISKLQTMTCFGYDINMHQMARLQSWSFGGIRSTSLLSLLSVPSSPREAVSVSVPSRGLIELFNHLIGITIFIRIGLIEFFKLKAIFETI